MRKKFKINCLHFKVKVQYTGCEQLVDVVIDKSLYLSMSFDSVIIIKPFSTITKAKYGWLFAPFYGGTYSKQNSRTTVKND